MGSDEIYNLVTDLVSKDRLNEAIKALWNHFEDEQILIHSAKLQSLKNEIISGTISYENAQIEKNKIRKAILSVASETKKEYTKKVKSRILRKLNLFANLFKNKKRNRFIVFWSFLLLIGGDKIKKIAIILSALILTLIGASFIIEYYNDSKTTSISNRIEDNLNQTETVSADSISKLNFKLNDYENRISELEFIVDSLKSLPNPGPNEIKLLDIENSLLQIEDMLDQLSSLIEEDGFLRRREKEENIKTLIDRIRLRLDELIRSNF